MIAAVAATIPTVTLELREVPDREPGRGELLVDVEACGICGTDLHMLEGASYPVATPFTLGHEPVGRVVATGSAEDSAWAGRRVTATLFTGCGVCAWCLAGDERICPGLVSIIGVLRAPGGFAQRLTIRTAQAVEVPGALTAAEAATLVDAGATAANAVRVIGRSPDGPLVVVGGGPVGFLAAELARAQGWDVTVVQTSRARREAIEALGHSVVASLDDVRTAPSVVIDAAGAPPVAPWALEHLGPHGMLVAAAYGPLDRMDLIPASRKELTVVGVRSGRRDDLVRALDSAASGAIRLPDISTWTLSGINSAFAALRAKTVAGKAVILPDARPVA